MIKPDSETMKAMAQSTRQFPAVLDYLENWMQYEVHQLPNVKDESVARAQGRCQVLKEVVDLLQKSPDYAAQSR